MNTVIVEKILKKPDFENHPATTAVWQKKKPTGPWHTDPKKKHPFSEKEKEKKNIPRKYKQTPGKYKQTHCIGVTCLGHFINDGFK
ncbi:hypothetical protein ACET3Z_014823 [Daucus carota]